MTFNLLMALIAVAFVLLIQLAIPFLKSKGLWLVTLFAVNIAEQIFNYAKAGEEKYKWVDSLLKQFMPKLTIIERNMVIEELVKWMKKVKEG